MVHFKIYFIVQCNSITCTCSKGLVINMGGYFNTITPCFLAHKLQIWWCFPEIKLNNYRNSYKLCVHNLNMTYMGFENYL